MDTLAITHYWTDGTTLHGTEKDSEAHRIAADDRSWLWRGSETVWGVRSSKRQRPKRPVIDAMVRKLEDAGYVVEVDLDDDVPSIADREQAEADRWDTIADRHETAAEKHRSAADGEHAKADAFYAHLPLGQPILVGHHSEKTDRNRRARAASQRDRGFAHQQVAETREDRAREAAAHMGARYNPETVGNRIEKLAAEERDLERRYDSSPTPEGEERDRLDGLLAQAREDLAYWRQVRTEQIADGTAVDPTAIEKGDWVKARHWWLPVRRVNKKTVTIPHPLSDWTVRPTKGEWTETTEFQKLRGHAKAADVDVDELEEARSR